MNITRERSRQLEVRALIGIKLNARRHGLDATAIAEFAHPSDGDEGIPG